MPDGEQKIFRARSLERLSTPDRLDQLLRVVKRRSWLPLVTTGAILLLALLWSFLGRVPITAEAPAVLVHPRQVVPFQMRAAGELVTLEVQVGAVVAKGDVIATLDIPELAADLAAAEARLAAFLERAAMREAVDREQAEKERILLGLRRKRLDTRIDELSAISDKLRSGQGAYAAQRKSLQALARLTDDRRGQLEKRLAAEGADREVEEAIAANRLRRAEIDVELGELAVRATEALERFAEHTARIDDLRTQLGDLRLHAVQTDRDRKEARLRTEAEAAELRSERDHVRARHRAFGRVLAPEAGRVLEVTAGVGDNVAAGTQLGSLAIDAPGDPLVGLAYFDVARGTRIAAGMHARVAPVTVQAARFGSLVARVERVSAYPVTPAAVRNQVGSRAMADALLAGRSRIEVQVALTPDAGSASGFRWTSAGGPATPVSAGTSARVTVTIEERAPITLLIPALRGWLGLD